jgi:chemotaxis protein histidine kinase CheA
VEPVEAAAAEVGARGPVASAVPRVVVTPVLPVVPADQGMVRVQKRRLDRLVAESGELRTARLRLDSRRLELEALEEQLQRWRAEWSLASKALARHARRRARKARGGENAVVANGGSNGNS